MAVKDEARDIATDALKGSALSVIGAVVVFFVIRAWEKTTR